MTPTPGPPPDTRPTRTYRSPLRTRRATETRQRIAASARDLFAEHGFAATTVAERAGVTPQTAYATFGSKGATVRALLAQLEDDAGAAGWLARVRAEEYPRRKLADFAAWTSVLLSSSKVALTAMQVAAGDPPLAEHRTQGDQNRRAALCRRQDGRPGAPLHHPTPAHPTWVAPFAHKSPAETGVERSKGATQAQERHGS